MKTEDLDTIISRGLEEEARRARFDRTWIPSAADGSRRRLPRIRRSIPTAAAAAVIAAGLLIPLALLAGLLPGVDGSRPGGEVVEDNGVRIELPQGWEARPHPPTDRTEAWSLVAANQPLDADDGHSGEFTRSRLGPDGIAIVLLDVTELNDAPYEDPPYEEVELPVTIGPDDFTERLEGIFPSHSAARVTFRVAGRDFDLRLEFGADPAPAPLVDEANAVLSTLEVEPAGDRTAGPGTLQGPGMTLELPPGWEGTSAGPTGTASEWTMVASNEPLPAGDDGLASLARRGLGPDGIAIVVYDVTEVAGAAFPQAELPVSIGDEHFGQNVEGTTPTHAFARRQVRIEGRDLDLWVEFGALPAAPEAVEAANAVLSTLEVEPAEDEEGGTVEYRDTDDGLSITVPEGWTFHQDPSGPDDPRTLFGVGTWAFPRGGECAPTEAQAALRAEGAFLWLIEYTVPQSPETTFLAEGEPLRWEEESLATYECSVVHSYLARFHRAGRFFQVHVAFGPDAPDRLREDAIAALDSLEVTAPVPDDCPHETGPWSDPDCPEPAWIRLVLESVGIDEAGDTGSAIVAREGPNEFTVWTTPEVPEEQLEDEGYRFDRTVDGGPPEPARLFTDGVRITWAVQGFSVWLAGATDALPPNDAVDEVVRGTIGVRYEEIDTR
jgi:hypothetical protein